MIRHGSENDNQSATRQVRWSRQAAAVIAVGVALVASVAFATPAQAAPSSVIVHSGDTLSSLAAKYCGSWSKWPSLFAANPSTKDANRIYVGQRLTINCNLPAPATGTAGSRSTTRTTTIPAGAWVAPLASYRLTSCWGDGRNHKGLDLAAGYGTAIRSVAAGVVVRTGWIGSGYGIEVIVRHADGWYSHSAHMKAVAVRVGQAVAAGQTVGWVGLTGQTTGAHVHFELSKVSTIFGHQLNPAPILRAHGVRIGC
jgi:murein DD-endopeptidase MepM/ murein hydrolase activator NlpD